MIVKLARSTNEIEKGMILGSSLGPGAMGLSEEGFKKRLIKFGIPGAVIGAGIGAGIGAFIKKNREKTNL